ncbi:uncharacterized protein LOC115921503 [Strongylocentrotus purpuratus]|uniref:Ig-like domain-containing protein n=1 Tax=Strongylocentrotus purpuratus TaxID=7668 RepID=A0A7M7NDG3_STRPU|nr:uncharacterized protein LOC115921503 [Strongylocentrotus purpuratus]
MKFYNHALVALLAVLFSGVDSNLEVITNPNATAYRGGNITLPCRFSGVPEAVYWHKHNRTGAPDDQATLVVSKVKDQDVYQPVDPRYDITTDHSLVISDVQIEDETTYSCEVSVPNAPTGKNYTALTVIALAKKLYPVVRGCMVTERAKPGKCVYEVRADTENFVLMCRVEQVKPVVSLSWTNQYNDERTINRLVTGPDEDGLFNATSELRVSRTEIENGDSFVCKATGESVKGTSALVVTVKYPSGLSSGGKAGIAIFVLIVIAVIGIGIGFFLWRRKKEQEKKEAKREAEMKDPEMEPLSPLQSKFEVLAEKIKNYKPGSFSRLEKKKGRIWPEVTRLGVFGVTNAGKSSLVRSLNFSLTGEFIDVEVATSESIGGLTTIPKPFCLTDHLTVVDNRGLKDLDVSGINGIMDQIREY